MIIALLLLSVLGILYPLVVYPVLVVVLARLRPRKWSEAPSEAKVAHIITVYNEERRIRAKLENTLSVRGPTSSVETIVVSDGSSDNTEAIVREYAGRGVKWLPCPRRGKEYAQLDAVRAVDASIIVFSDASTLLDRDSLCEILLPFDDPSVLAVSGTDRVEGRYMGSGEALYIRCEMALRRAEALAGSLVGLSGCFFATRRVIATRWRPDVPSDMGSALLAMSEGGRAVAAPGAVCRYQEAGTVEAEFQRRRRMALRGLRCLLAYRRAYCRQWIAAWQVISHKWCRFLIPFWAVLLATSATAATLLGELRLVFPVLLGALAVVAAACGIVVPSLRRNRVIRILDHIAVSNLAVLSAWKDLLLGRTQVNWLPTSRP